MSHQSLWETSKLSPKPGGGSLSVATPRRPRLSGRQHVVVAVARDASDGKAPSVAPGARHRGGHGQTVGARTSRKGLCRCVLV